MKTLKQLLAEKDQELACVAPGDTIIEALTVMARRNVGAVLVLEGKKLVGIFTERDYARKLALQGRNSRETLVRDVMSERVAYVSPETPLENCMALMTEKHFRHLPVLNPDGTVVGIVSIGDLVKETIHAQQFIISELERYIAS